ncbi:MAG: hypothetical protein AB7O26_08425 [Planctomycetaceae bacterium]
MAVRDESGRDRTGTDTAAAEQGEREKAEAGSTSDVQPTAGASRTDSEGRKWLGDIPYDVWFDDPLSVVGKGIESSQAATSGNASKGPDAMVKTGATPGPLETNAESEIAGESTDASTKSGKGSSAGGWKQLVSVETLDAEVKTIRNNLAAALQSVGKYNAKYKDVQVLGSTLAAIGEIAAEHPDAVRWKRNALHVREIGSSIESSADKTGGDAYRATKASYDALTGLLDGNSAAGLEEPPARGGFSEFADRGGLMKRIESGFRWLKKEISSESSLQANSAKVVHEAEILAALGRAIEGNDYASADEADYAAHAKAFIEAAVEMSKAGSASQLPALIDARDRVQKKCDECHSAYRF